MTWEIIAPVTKPRAEQKTGVLIGAEFSKRGKASMRVTVRPQYLGLAWLKRDATVTVYLGAGEHAGMISIMPEGAFKLSLQGAGDKKVIALALRLPLPAHVTGPVKATPCRFDLLADGLVIDLPDWAMPPAKAAPETCAAAQPAPRQAAPLATRQPAAKLGAFPPFTGPVEFTQRSGRYTWKSALKWAEDNGVDTLTGDDDEVLARINDARRDIGMKPFALTPERAEVVA